MKNIADAIESFIISQMQAESGGEGVLVQRNELAGKLDCAPSQISYVLRKRFTPANGFMVESRRGTGGFVRIVRIVPHEEQEKEPTVAEILAYWLKNHMLTAREYALLTYFMSIMDLDEDGKKKILRQAVSKMVEPE